MLKTQFDESDVPSIHLGGGKGAGGAGEWMWSDVGGTSSLWQTCAPIREAINFNLASQLRPPAAMATADFVHFVLGRVWVIEV